MPSLIVRLTEEEKAALQRLAEKEIRSINSMVRYLIHQAVRDQLADDNARGKGDEANKES